MSTFHKGLLPIFLAIPILLSFKSFAGKIPDTVANIQQLEALLNKYEDTIKIVFRPGDFHLTPHNDLDTSIKELDTVPTPVHITYGLKFNASYVMLKGSPAYGTAIYTNSGYGIYFENCKNVTVEGLIITGGQRDSDALATDAAIVAKNSKVDIVGNLIFENLGDTVDFRKSGAGIMGICAREGAKIFVFNNQIAHNSWHGIGVYRDASATITGNLVDGVDKQENGKFTGGMGIGIFFTRNAHGSIETNVIKRYSRGIGIFNSASALVSENLIEDIQQWGIVMFDADTGRPRARIENNVVYKTGACGAGVVSYLEGKGERGYFRNNILVETAQNRNYDAPNRYCYQCALAVQGRPDKFNISDNVFYKNFWLSPCNNNLDSTIADFVQILQSRFSTLPLRWYAGYSEFIQRFYFYVRKKE